MPVSTWTRWNRASSEPGFIPWRDPNISTGCAGTGGKWCNREEMAALLPTGVKPLRGAVEVYSRAEIKQNPILGTRLVGKPLGTSLQGEKELTDAQFVARLEALAGVPGYSSRLLMRTAAYLKTNGVKYYGVVVAGHPADLLRLEHNRVVTAAVIGIVTTPW